MFVANEYSLVVLKTESMKRNVHLLRKGDSKKCWEYLQDDVLVDSKS